MKLSSVFVLIGVARACQDDAQFLDELGQDCSAYSSLSTCLNAVGLSPLGLERVLGHCQKTCNSCVKAAEFCEIGLGGDQYSPPPVVENFDFYEGEHLTTQCQWIDTPQGLRQTTNAWGPTPVPKSCLCTGVVRSRSCDHSCCRDKFFFF